MHRITLVVALSFILVLAGSCLAFAQKVAVIPLVPAANWRLVSAQKLGVDDIKNDGGELAIEREYGVKSFEVRTYQLESAYAEVVVEPAADVSGAYGLFTYYQNESMHPEKIIQLAMTGSVVSLMARGRTFIRFIRPKGVSENDFRALMVLVGGTRPTSDSLANLPPSLPPAGLVLGSAKYIIGPEAAQRVLPWLPSGLIGFDQGAEVETGEYVAGNSRATLVEVS